MIRIAEPRIGDRERQAVLDVLASGRLTGGPYTQRLEEAFARDVSGTAEAVAVSSGTAALHLALLAHDIGPGDEVITSPFSFQATANMVLATGARPVFADVAPDGNLDPARVEAAITPRTRALLPVHLYGRLCDMPALYAIATRHGLAIIEDAAQAHGARVTTSPATPSAGPGVFPVSTGDAAQAHGARPTMPPSTPSAGSGVSPATSQDAPQAHRATLTWNPRGLANQAGSPSPRKERGPGGEDSPAGVFDTTGCFSLYATKNLTAGEGGIITTNDPAIAGRVRRLRSHGEAERYESIEVGYNYRITEVGAALALTQLEGLAEANQRRRDNATYLSQHLQGVEVPEAPADEAAHVWHQYTIRLHEGRDELQSYLRDRGIEAMVYYPKTLPAQKLYRDLGYDDSAFPMARRLAAEVLSLPVHPALSTADLQTIVGAVNVWAAAHKPRRMTAK